MRNPLTAWTKGHEVIASKAGKVMGLTATPVFNKPQDLMGIGTAIDLAPKWKEATTWFKDRKKTVVNLQTLDDFQEFIDRATDDILNLPEIVDHYINFDASIDPMHVEDYNEALANARRLRFSLERRGRATQQELQQLMSYLQNLQQFIVSPLLAEKGAKAVQKDEKLIQQASLQDTGALQALKKAIIDLQDEKYARVMVACCHTSLLVVADCYLKRECPGIGNIIQYHGGLSLKKRGEATTAFLDGPKTVLLMSIDAGGTGLHLVPGANAVVFWGSRPFSPQQVKQTKKRVHRIGQEFPVKVVHLIAEGSVDHAINFVHKDKLRLANAVTDGDTAGLEAEGGKWRSTGRIVDRCKFLSEDGQFPEDEITEAEMLERFNRSNGGGSSSDPIEDGDDDDEMEEEDGDDAAAPIAQNLIAQAAAAAGNLLPGLFANVAPGHLQAAFMQAAGLAPAGDFNESDENAIDD